MVKAYKVVESDSSELLEDAVNNCLEAGFVPQGGVYVLRYEFENDRKGYSESCWKFYQAMVHRVE